MLYRPWAILPDVRLWCHYSVQYATSTKYCSCSWSSAAYRRAASVLPHTSALKRLLIVNVVVKHAILYEWSTTLEMNQTETFRTFLFLLPRNVDEERRENELTFWYRCREWGQRPRLPTAVIKLTNSAVQLLPCLAVCTRPPSAIQK